MTALALDLLQLAEIKNALVARIEAGLAKDGQEIKVLPAFLAPPKEGLTGRALAIDTGGTNLRAAVLEVSSQATRVIEGPIGATVPSGRDGTPVDRDAFFGVHADIVAKLKLARGLPIGFCFSYPSAVEPSLDARLISWTKGIDVEGVVGTLVGEGLVDALKKRDLAPGRVTVLNDTVASLLAASSLTPASSRTIGLIVGTGHNIASFFAGERITKLSTQKVPVAHGVMAVNLESGNFHPPFLTPFDDAVDARSDNHGRQRMEKAVSGFYLPQIFAAAMPGRIEAVLVPDTNRRSRLPSQTLKTRFLRAIPIAPRCKCTVFATAFTG